MFSDSCFPFLSPPAFCSWVLESQVPCVYNIKGRLYCFSWGFLFVCLGVFVWFGFLFCFLLFFLCIKLGDSCSAHPYRTSLPFQSRTAAPQLCCVPAGDSDRTQNEGHRRKWKVILCNSCVSCLMRQLILLCRASWWLQALSKVLLQDSSNTLETPWNMCRRIFCKLSNSFFCV